MAIVAVGIGLNGAAFGALNAILLRPLPYNDPHRVVMVWNRSKVTTETQRLLTTPSDLRVMRERAGEWIEIAAVEIWEANPSAQMDLISTERPERLRGAFATPNLFQVLGVKPLLGRLPDASSELEDEAVLSYNLWQRAFGADADIVGNRITLAAGVDRTVRTLSIAAVLPRRVTFTYPLDTQVWVMRGWSRMESGPRSAGRYWMVGRLKEGISIDAGKVRLSGLAQATERELRDPYRKRLTSWMESAQNHVTGDVQPHLALLGAAAIVVLLIASTNLACILLVDSVRRTREVAIRAALGCTRGRLARQLIIEILCLAGCGSALGLVLAIAAIPAMRAVIPLTIPRVDEIAVDWPLFLSAVLLGGIVGMLASVLPVLFTLRQALYRVLAEDGPTVSSSRRSIAWNTATVSLQVAIGLALLMTTSVVFKSWRNLQAVDLGFNPSGIATAQVRLLHPKYRDPAVQRQFQADALARLRSLPAVATATMASAIPMRGVDWMGVVERDSNTQLQRSAGARIRHVDWQYFSAMGIPVRRGRTFSQDDFATSPPVAVVSDTLARSLFGDDDPIGQRLSGRPSREIVGVVGDVRYASPAADPAPAVYLPLSQAPSELLCIIARPREGLALNPIDLRSAIHEIDPLQPVESPDTLNAILEDSLAEIEFFASASLAFAATAVLLTMLGVFGLASHVIATLTPEIGIRVTFGASPNAIVRLAAIRIFRPVVVGMVIGTVAGFWVTQVLQKSSFLPRGQAVSPEYLWTIAILAFASLVSSSLPMLRAARLGPAGIVRRA